MKNIFMFWIAFASVADFGQEKQTTMKPSEQMKIELLNDNNKRAIAQVGECRKSVEESFAKYKAHLATRTKLTNKLQRALADGDETLIQVAVSDLDGNRRNLEMEAEWLIKTYGEKLLDRARDAYKNELITEEVYIEHLKFYRQSKALTEQTLPEELTNVIKQAKEKLLDYFAILEMIHGHIKTWP